MGDYQDIISKEESIPLISSPPKKVIISIDIHDWKWISNIKRYTLNISDFSFLSNQEKEQEIQIDTSSMIKSDSEGKSKFLVANRFFYEAHVFGFYVTSFTSSGYLNI